MPRYELASTAPVNVNLALADPFQSGILLDAQNRWGTTTPIALLTNVGIAMPLTVHYPVTVYKLWYSTGTVAGNVDMGIYDENYNLVVSSGATAMANPNSIQVLDIVDTNLSRGRYYLAISASSSTATFGRYNSSFIGYIRSQGVTRQTSAHPLPSTFTPAVAIGTGDQIIISGAIVRPWE